MLNEKKYIISGHVQGVGFRWFVNKQANAIGLKGSVRNLSDNRVEVIAQGSAEQLEFLELKLWQGPAMSRVDTIQMVNNGMTEEMSAFSII